MPQSPAADGSAAEVTKQQLRTEDPDVARALSMAQQAAEILHSRPPKAAASTALIGTNNRSSIRVRRRSLEQVVPPNATSDPEFMHALAMARKAAEILHSRKWARVGNIGERLDAASVAVGNAELPAAAETVEPPPPPVGAAMWTLEESAVLEGDDVSAMYSMLDNYNRQLLAAPKKERKLMKRKQKAMRTKVDDAADAAAHRAVLQRPQGVSLEDATTSGDRGDEAPAAAEAADAEVTVAHVQPQLQPNAAHSPTEGGLADEDTADEQAEEEASDVQRLSTYKDGLAYEFLDAGGSKHMSEKHCLKGRGVLDTGVEAHAAPESALATGLEALSAQLATESFSCGSHCCASVDTSLYPYLLCTNSQIPSQYQQNALNVPRAAAFGSSQFYSQLNGSTACEGHFYRYLNLTAGASGPEWVAQAQAQGEAAVKQPDNPDKDDIVDQAEFAARGTGELSSQHPAACETLSRFELLKVAQKPALPPLEPALHGPAMHVRYAPSLEYFDLEKEFGRPVVPAQLEHDRNGGVLGAHELAAKAEVAAEGKGLHDPIPLVGTPVAEPRTVLEVLNQSLGSSVVSETLAVPADAVGSTNHVATVRQVVGSEEQEGSACVQVSEAATKGALQKAIEGTEMCTAAPRGTIEQQAVFLDDQSGSPSPADYETPLSSAPPSANQTPQPHGTRDSLHFRTPHTPSATRALPPQPTRVCETASMRNVKVHHWRPSGKVSAPVTAYNWMPEALIPTAKPCNRTRAHRRTGSMDASTELDPREAELKKTAWRGRKRRSSRSSGDITQCDDNTINGYELIRR